MFFHSISNKALCNDKPYVQTKQTQTQAFSTLSSMKNSYKILLFIAFCLAPLALNLGSLLIKPFSFSEGYFSSASKISPHVIPDDEVPFNWDVNELTKHCLVVDDLCRSPHMFFYHPDPTGRKHQPNVLFKLDSGLWFDSETVHRKFYRFLLLNESIVTPALLDQSSTCTRSPIQNHVSRREYVQVKIS